LKIFSLQLGILLNSWREEEEEERYLEIEKMKMHREIECVFLSHHAL